MTEPENEMTGKIAEGDDDSNLILAAEIRRLLPALREIAASLKNIEAALSPSGYATSLFEALRLINMSMERIRITHFDKPLTRDEAKLLDLLFPETPEAASKRFQRRESE
jgi:hypothetical protein